MRQPTDTEITWVPATAGFPDDAHEVPIVRRQRSSGAACCKVTKIRQRTEDSSWTRRGGAQGRGFSRRPIKELWALTVVPGLTHGASLLQAFANNPLFLGGPVQLEMLHVLHGIHGIEGSIPVIEVRERPSPSSPSVVPHHQLLSRSPRASYSFRLRHSALAAFCGG